MELTQEKTEGSLDLALERKALKKKLRKEKNRRFFRAMFSRRLVIIGLIGFLFFVFIAVFADVLTPYDPDTQDAYALLQGPGATHLLGTDQFGRDTLTRIMYGARVSIIVGVVAVAIACVVGVFLGLCAAYFGGWADTVIMRCSEALMAVPRIMVSMAMIAILGNSIMDLAVILSFSTIPFYVRMTRAMALGIKNSDYVKAAQIQGAGSMYIMFRHVLPNSISPIIIMMMQQVGTTILMESGLSFLGIGITIPIASWGTMVEAGRSYLLVNPAMSIAPGACVALLVISLNLLGDGIRDALDPRLRGEV